MKVLSILVQLMHSQHDYYEAYEVFSLDLLCMESEEENAYGLFDLPLIRYALNNNFFSSSENT